MLPPFSEAFAAVVIEYRLKSGLSKSALAEKAGLHQTYISLLETCQRSPNILTAKAIADALDVPLSRMVRDAEKKSEKFGQKITDELQRLWQEMRQADS